MGHVDRRRDGRRVRSSPRERNPACTHAFSCTRRRGVRSAAARPPGFVDRRTMPAGSAGRGVPWRRTRSMKSSARSIDGGRAGSSRPAWIGQRPHGAGGRRIARFREHLRSARNTRPVGSVGLLRAHRRSGWFVRCRGLRGDRGQASACDEVRRRRHRSGSGIPDQGAPSMGGAGGSGVYPCGTILRGSGRVSGTGPAGQMGLSWTQSTWASSTRR